MKTEFEDVRPGVVREQLADDGTDSDVEILDADSHEPHPKEV